MGLSPRVRGNRAGEVETLCVDGTIPACTGEPAYWERWMLTTRDYPRVYGGTTVKRKPNFSIWGLSPRVRGNPE